MAVLRPGLGSPQKGILFFIRTVPRPAFARLALVLFSLAGGSLLVAAEPAAKKKDKAGNATKAASGPARWEETIQRFEAADVANPPAKGGVLLVGGSNARRWTDVAERFPAQTVLNRGFGGAQLADVLHFADRIVVPYAPKTILLNAGGNDLSAGQTPEQIRDVARVFAAKIRAALPGTRIVYLSLPPVLRAAGLPDALATIKKLNGLLATLAAEEKNLEFVDLFPAFLGADGQSRAELFVEDGTHFSAAGYVAVADLVRGKL